MQEQFVEGMPVFDSDDEKIGTVAAYYPGEGYLDVRKGWLFTKDIYVPIAEVTRNDADGIYLSVHRDDLMGERYEHAPLTRADGNGRDAATDTTGTQRQATVPTEVMSAEDVRIPLAQEELLVAKEEVERGRVHLHKDVLEERATVTGEVRREVLRLERVPAQTLVAAGPDAFVEREFEITVMGEQLIPVKRALVTEEIRVSRRQVSEEQQVTEMVRRERVSVEGADEVRGDDQEVSPTA